MGEVVGAVANIARVAASVLPPPFSFVASAGAFALAAVSGGSFGRSRPRIRSATTTLPSSAQDRVQNLRSAVDSHVAVYGTARVGVRPWVYAESSGADQRFLHLIGPLAGHEIAEVTELLLDDERIDWASDVDGDGNVLASSNGRFTRSASLIASHGAFVRVHRHLGGDDQVADATAVGELANWAADHRGRGIAYLSLRLLYDRTAFANGIPQTSAVVKGRRVWDPRESAQDPDDAATWAWSNNWALCLLDYLRADFGLAASLDEIDLASFIAAANISDEPVPLAGGSPAETQPRYSCDGVVDLDEKPIEVMEDLLSAGAGALSYSGGRYHLFAGAYLAPTMTLSADDLAGPIEVQTRVERRELFNAVRGTFVSPEEGYQPTDFPPRENPLYQTQDGGQQIFRDIELPYTQDRQRAQRIAEIHLRKSRQGITLRFPAKLRALDLAVFDSVAVTLDGSGVDLGWSAKVFRVMSWRFSDRGGVDLVLQEEAADSWDWDAGTAVTHDSAPDTALPDPYQVAPPDGLGFESGNAQLLIAGDGTVISRIKVTWAAIEDAFVTQGGQVEVQYRDSALGGSPIDWADGNSESVVAPGKATSAFLAPVKDGATYDVRVRAINQLGVASDADDATWQRSLQHTVVGKTEAPPKPDGLTVSRAADGTRIYQVSQANPPADVRVGGGWRIRYRQGVTADWETMTPLHSGLLTAFPFESNELAAGSYSFAAKTVDSSGNESDEALFSSATLGDPRLREVLVARLEHDLGFPGDKSDCFVDSDGSLRSATVGGWQALPASWSALPASWREILPSPAQIRYAVELDLGADLSFTPLVTVEGQGAPTVEMRTGGDGDSPPVSGPYGPLLPVLAQRYIEIRVTMQATASPPEPTAIEALTILLDGETRIEDFNDIDTSGADSQVFERLGSGHFRLAASELVTITQASITAIQNAGPGFSWELISKAATAFGSPGKLAAEFKLYDALGAPADALIDATLKGPKSS